MTTRNIKKSLAGMEDLVQGIGTVSQTRAGEAVEVTRVDVPLYVEDETAMSALDVSKWTRARIYDTPVSFTDYIYDPDSLEGIGSDTGPGTWLEANFKPEAEEVLNHATLAAALADPKLVEGDAINFKERTVGNGGGGVCDVVLASSVTISPNSPTVGDIIQCTGIPSLALKIRVGNKLTDRQIGLLGDGSDTSAYIQDWFDIGKERGATILEGTRGSLYDNIVETLTLPSGMTLYGNMAEFKSTDLTSKDILLLESFTTVTKCVFTGGEPTTEASSRKVRALHAVGDLDTIKVSGNHFLHFYITGVYASGDRDNIPKNIRVTENYFDGSNKQLQGVTIFCGANGYIDNNIIDNMDSLPILVDEATNTTPMPNYGKLDNIHVTNNIINFDAPTNTSVLYGIQMTACEVGSITNNTINGLQDRGRAIVCTLYDLAQQKNRVENFGEEVYTPINQQKARMTISDNRITSGGAGIYCTGYTAPLISDNQIVAGLPLYIDTHRATISGQAYVYPSTTDDGLNPTDMNSQVKDNICISTEVANECVYVASRRNYFLDNIYLGDFTQRYNAPNGLSTHVVRDADQSMAVSGTPLIGNRLSGVIIPAAGAGAANVSFVEGSGNVLERFLGYAPDDYHVIITGDWEGAGNAYVPDSVKSNDGFQVNFPSGSRPPTSTNKLWWTVVHSESYRP